MPKTNRRLACLIRQDIQARYQDHRNRTIRSWKCQSLSQSIGESLPDNFVDWVWGARERQASVTRADWTQGRSCRHASTAARRLWTGGTNPQEKPTA